MSQTVGSLSGSGGVQNNNSILVIGDATSTTFSGTIQGTGNLRKVGAGTLTLTGANTYSGQTFVNAGTLMGTTVGIQGNVFNDSAVVFDQSFLGTYAGNMDGGGSLTKNGGGTVILAGFNTYTGGTTVNAGTLQGDPFSLPGNILNNASLVFDHSFDSLYDGVVSGSGSFTKQGTGTLQLTGANTYTGSTFVNAGILQLGGNDRLPDMRATTVNSTLDMNGFSDSIGSLTGGGVIINSGGLTLGGTGASTTFSGTTGGAGGLTKVGAGWTWTRTRPWSGRGSARG